MTTQFEATKVPQAVKTEYKKPSVGAKIGGVVAGYALHGIATQPATKIISPNAMTKMAEISDNLSMDEFVQVENAIKDNLKKTGLADKGIEIVRASSENVQEIKDIMAKEFSKGIAKLYPKMIKTPLTDSSAIQATQGKNAFYAMQSKKLVLPAKGLSLAGFHEMGHALNANSSKIGKILQKSRAISALGLPIMLIALLKTKKAPDEEPKGALDKTTTFIKNNAGKLTFATFLPVLLEEGLASMKGNKIAKSALSPELAKKVAKSNALGFSTYLALATLSGLGVWLANKVKDKIAGPKLVENKVA